MKVTKGTILDLQGKPLVAKARIELDETPGVSVWGGNFRLPQPAPSMDLFRPQCVVKLEDGRQGKVTIGRCDRTTAYFLGNGRLEPGPAPAAEINTQPAASAVATPSAAAHLPANTPPAGPLPASVRRAS